MKEQEKKGERVGKREKRGIRGKKKRNNKQKKREKKRKKGAHYKDQRILQNQMSNGIKTLKRDTLHGRSLK